MKHFFNTLLILIIAAMLFYSCKKSSTPAPVVAASSSSMVLTYNSTKLAFNNCFEATASVNNAPEIIIIGNNITGSKVSDNSFEVDITADATTLKPGAVFQAASSFGQLNVMTLFFFSDTTNTYTTQPKSPAGIVTITDVSSTYIKGTFSGKLFASDDFSATNLLYTVTNGTFVAKRTDN